MAFSDFINSWKADASSSKREKYLLKSLGDLQLAFIIESGSNSVTLCCTNHVLCFGTVYRPTDGQSESCRVHATNNFLELRAPIVNGLFFRDMTSKSM